MFISVIDQFEHPICYISQKLNCHQKAYSTIEKEALSLLIAIRRFSIYFGSHEVTVYTNHDPLTFLDRMSNTNNKLLRWRLELQEYKLLIKHRKWKDNVIPDILSRPPEVDITKFYFCINSCCTFFTSKPIPVDCHDPYSNRRIVGHQYCYSCLTVLYNNDSFLIVN